MVEEPVTVEAVGVKAVKVVVFETHKGLRRDLSMLHCGCMPKVLVIQLSNVRMLLQ